MPTAGGAERSDAVTIQEDLYCVSCGYNLRGLSVAASDVKCPECGTLVGKAKRGSQLAEANARWVRRLCYGATAMCLAPAVLFVLVAAMVVTEGLWRKFLTVESFDAISMMLFSLPAMCYAGGLHLATTPELPGPGMVRTARFWVRLANTVLVTVVVVMLQLLALLPGVTNVAGVVACLGCGCLWLAGSWWSARLMQRVHRRSLVRFMPYVSAIVVLAMLMQVLLYSGASEDQVAMMCSSCVLIGGPLLVAWVLSAMVAAGMHEAYKRAGALL